MKNITIAFIITVLFFTIWSYNRSPQVLQMLDTAFNYTNGLIDSLAAAIIHRPITVTELKDKYISKDKKVRVLIVPGHEPNYGGSEYRDLKERDMNVELATYLGEFLKNNSKYDVMLARDKDNWSPTLLNYFNNYWDNITTFMKDSVNERKNLIAIGEAKKTVATVYHNTARTDVATRLYGINKWSNDNRVDIVIHIHFNDYPRKNTSAEGKYSGFTIYIPESQYDNSVTTKLIAETVFKRLAKYNAYSNLPTEQGGFVEEPDLIAIGSHNTLDSASMLIEYGYIYEWQFANADIRSATMKDLAFETYLGLQDFFGVGKDIAYAYDTLMLPYSWKEGFDSNTKNSQDVLALQTALILDGVYPPQGKDKNSCPRTGNIGPCTKAAIVEFQNKYNIKGENGVIGKQTNKLLNDRYSVKTIY
ncbi:MAG TPA: N-acetylmuramoyl-L-alanine amidase [Candidatus Paceibacterota bacterium]